MFFDLMGLHMLPFHVVVLLSCVCMLKMSKISAVFL